MRTTKAGQNKGLILKTIIVWSGILVVLGFLFATRSADSPVTMSVIPEVPRTGEPIVATFNISNLSGEPATTRYQLFINGRLMGNGSTTIAPLSSSKYQYAYNNCLERGEQANFMLKTSSDNGDIDRLVSLPAYPSQLMSSFVSFAAFSTSVMSSMISMEYFSNTFDTTSQVNIGVILSIVLIVLLIFLELTQAWATGRRITVIASYQAGFSTVSTILFIIILGMMFTKIVMIIAT